MRKKEPVDLEKAAERWGFNAGSRLLRRAVLKQIAISIACNLNRIEKLFHVSGRNQKEVSSSGFIRILLYIPLLPTNFPFFFFFASCVEKESFQVSLWTQQYSELFQIRAGKFS
jgi:hypothetical protein